MQEIPSLARGSGRSRDGVPRLRPGSATRVLVEASRRRGSCCCQEVRQTGQIRYRFRQECAGSAEVRSEEHTSELQSRLHLVCRLLLEKKKKHELCILTLPHTPRSRSRMRSPAHAIPVYAVFDVIPIRDSYPRADAGHEATCPALSARR